PEPDGALDGSGLPGPVRAENAEDLALSHREGHVVHRDHRPVGLPEMRYLHGWLAGRPRPGGNRPGDAKNASPSGGGGSRYTHDFLPVRTPRPLRAAVLRSSP